MIPCAFPRITMFCRYSPGQDRHPRGRAGAAARGGAAPVDEDPPGRTDLTSGWTDRNLDSPVGQSWSWRDQCTCVDPRSPPWSPV